MKKTQGFTLIELLVVIAIIGILSSVVLASLNSAREKARDAKRVSDTKQVQLALEVYYDDATQYPLALTDLTPDYLPAVPVDPSPSGTAYAYTQVDNGTDYCFAVVMEGSVPEGDVNCEGDTGTDPQVYSVRP